MKLFDVLYYDGLCSIDYLKHTFSIEAVSYEEVMEFLNSAVHLKNLRMKYIEIVREIDPYSFKYLT